jgi:hypothetical protein
MKQITRTKSNQTSNYDIFSLIKCNRKISKTKVFSLAEKIKLKGQLVPIMIDSKFNIYDGQHRFYACKKLNIPVRYDVYDNLTEDHIGELNSTSTTFSTQTWIEHFNNRGFPEYKKLIFTYSQYPKITKGVINLAFYAKYAAKINYAIKEGKYELSISKGEFLMKCMNILNNVKGDAFSVKVCRALIRIFKYQENRRNFEEARLEKCSEKYMIQTTLNNEAQIAQSIVSAYNRNKKGKILTL